MAPQDDVADEAPTQINPYEVLGVKKSATEDEIKRAYRKCALKHHPDKAPEHLKSDSHTKFQEIAFAYAVLSDSNRRKRYDRTGSTSESVDADGFSWSNFYSEQYRDIVTADAIEEFSTVYKGSVEEKDDLLAAYTKFEGKWGKIYQVVMLSDPVNDEERFREIIEEAIKKGEVKEYAVFRKETSASKARRMKNAREEEKEAAKAAKEMGLKVSSRGAPEQSKKPKKEAGGHMDDLAAIIQARQRARMGENFFDKLTERYAPGGNRSTKDPGDLDEEEFQRIQKGLGKTKNKAKGKGNKAEVNAEDDVESDEEPAPKKKKSLRGKKKQSELVVEEEEEEEEDEDEDEEMGDGGNDQAEEAEEEEEEVEEEKPAPKKRARKQATRQSKRTKIVRA